MDSKKNTKGRSMNAMDESESLTQHTMVRFIKGATVGLVASAMLQPLQVVKTSMQISPIHLVEAQQNKKGEIKPGSGNPPPAGQSSTMQAQTIDLNKTAEKAKKPGRRIECMTFREATRHIYVNEGSKGFLRGLVPSLLKNSLMTGQYFSILFYME